MNFKIQLKELSVRPILKELSWYTLGQITVQVFSFLGVVVTSRYLGPTNLGLYSFVQNYLSVFMVITTGMDFYFMWKVTKSEHKIHDLKEYFGYKLYVTITISFVGTFLAWCILPKDVAVMATVLFVPLFLNSCTAFLQYAIASNRARLVATIQTLAAAILFLVKIVFISISLPLIAFVAVNAIDTVFTAVLLALFFLWNKELRQTFLSVRFPSFSQTIAFLLSIRMSLIAMGLWQLILRADQLVLSTFSNAYTLGIYASAVKIAEVPNFFVGVLYASLVSRVAVTAIKNDKDSNRHMSKILLTYLFFGSAAAVMIALLSPFLVHLLYGVKFLEVIPVLRIYAFSIPGMFLCLHFFSIYGTREKQGRQALIFLCGLALNIILVYSLTPFMGIMGTALATVIAYTFLALVFYFDIRQKIF